MYLFIYFIFGGFPSVKQLVWHIQERRCTDLLLVWWVINTGISMSFHWQRLLLCSIITGLFSNRVAMESIWIVPVKVTSQERLCAAMLHFIPGDISCTKGCTVFCSRQDEKAMVHIWTVLMHSVLLFSLLAKVLFEYYLYTFIVFNL